jgi:hypothetical protein
MKKMKFLFIKDEEQIQMLEILDYIIKLLFELVGILKGKMKI